MRKINAELKGGTGQIDNLNRDFSQDFSPVCRDIFSTKVLADAKQTGLLGIKNNSDFIEKYDLANKAYRNEDIWKQDLLSKIKKIKEKIVRYGPAALNDPGKMSTISEESDLSLDKSISIAIKKFSTQFKSEYENIKKQMQKNLKYSLPPLDENFYKNISDFTQSSQKYFKKKLVHECVMGEKYDLTIDSKKILQGLKQSNSTTQGTNVINYRNQLARILGQDSFFEDKIAAIRKLDKKYNGRIVYTYRDPRTGVVSRPPSTIYKSAIKACTQQINLDNTFAKAPSQNNLSNIKQAARQLKILSEKARTFTNDIANNIYQRVNNCNGRVLKAGSCNDNTLNPKWSGFCIAHATSCANAIRSCHQNLSNKINAKINTLKNMGNRWDESVKNFVKKQQNYLDTTFFPLVSTITEQIRKHLPGATNKYDSDTFIKLPSSEISEEFGIDMLGGGNTEGISQLPDLIEKNLIGMLSEQKQKLGTEYDQYISDKENSIKHDLGRWKELADSCKQLEEMIAKNIEKINRARQKSWNESRKSARDFCAKYDFVRQNPAAGCDSLEELYSNSIRTSGMIDPNVNIHLNRFMGYCSEYNNEQDSSKDEDEPDSTLKQLCETYDNKYENIKEPLMEMASTTVPEEYKEQVLDYLQAENPNIDSINELSHPQRRHLKNVRSLLYVPDDNHKITPKIVDGLIKTSYRTKKDAYELFNKDGQNVVFSEWKNDDTPITIDDLFKIRKDAPNDKLKQFFIEDSDQSKKIINQLQQNFDSFKPNTDDLCTKHMNHSLYQAAKICAEKNSSNPNCLKNELDTTAWSKQFSDVEKKLSKLVSFSDAIVAQELGEQAQGRCVAPLSNQPKRKKPSMFDLLFPDGNAPPTLRGIGL